MSFTKHTRAEGFEPVATADEKIVSLEDLDERLAAREEDEREAETPPREAA